MRKPSPLTWDTSWLIGSAAPSILKVSKSSASGLRDDSGRVCHTMLRDQRAAWLREGRLVRIVPGATAAAD